MIVLGLTGSIGMGKSATADMFRAAGVPVHDSDKTVHALYAGGAAAAVDAAFPGALVNGVVDRGRLGTLVLNDSAALARLEAIIHPLVRQERDAFLRDCRAAKERIAVLDIPLLLELGGQKEVEAVVVVSAPAVVQKQRVLARAGMSEEKFKQILAKQMPDAQKKRLAHFVVDTGRGFASAERQVRAIIAAMSFVEGQS